MSYSDIVAVLSFGDADSLEIAQRWLDERDGEVSVKVRVPVRERRDADLYMHDALIDWDANVLEWGV